MWEINEPTISKTILDFSSSGQSSREVSQLIAGNTVLMNGLELTEWIEDGTQALICSSCGYPGCESGGWVAFRKAGNRVFLIPAFELIEGEKDRYNDEYAAPSYISKQGIPFFDLSTYNALISANVGFPSVDRISQLRLSEAARLVQMEAPYRLFGDPPRVTLQRDKENLVVAASEGEHKNILAEVLAILTDLYNDQGPAQLTETGADGDVVSVFLDADEFVEFKCLVRRDTEARLLLSESLFIEPVITLEDSL
jgi:hypothetical protein